MGDGGGGRWGMRAWSQEQMGGVLDPATTEQRTKTHRDSRVLAKDIWLHLKAANSR